MDNWYRQEVSMLGLGGVLELTEDGADQGHGR